MPAGRIFTVADIANDPHYHARDMIIAQEMLDGSVLHVPGIVPKLSRTPGRISRQAPEVGQDNREILQEIGLTDEQITALEARGIIWSQA